MKIAASSLAPGIGEPRVVVQMGYIDNQRISLPVAYGVAEIRGIDVGAMRPAIGRYDAKASRLISIAAVNLIKKHGDRRGLDNLPRRACARDAERFTVECRIVMNSV